MIRRSGFLVTLPAVMASATFALIVFGVLSAEIIAEFGVARWQVGALVTASSLTGGLVSPRLGRWADRLGARRAALLTLAISALALLLVSIAPAYLLLVGAALVTGIAQAGSNPATNKLISLHLPPGRRGTVTGVKQSGVQMGSFLGGLFLPVGATAWGWRWAVAVAGFVPVLFLLLAAATVPADPPVVTAGGDGSGGPLPPIIRRLAVYGFLLGAGGTAIFTYLPLYAREALGFSGAEAGAAVAVLGAAGIAGRILWGRVAEHRLGSKRVLTILAVLAVAAGLVLAAGPMVGGAAVWVAALLTGASASAWNAVGMLAIIQTVPAAMTGRGSGVVLFGFLAGLGLGAPAFGWSVDVLGRYTPGWLVVAGLFAAGWWVIVRAPEGLPTAGRP